jgi:hypothetical protein
MTEIVAKKKGEQRERPPEVVRVVGTAAVFFLLEALRPNDWVNGLAELPVFLIEVLVGMYVVDGAWALYRRQRKRVLEDGEDEDVLD